MGGVQKIGHAAVSQGPSVVKEIVMATSAGLVAASFWKMNHLNNKRKAKEFYQLLDKDVITLVAQDE